MGAVLIGSGAVYVCLCHAVTERDIRRAVAEGCADLEALAQHTGCGSGCGTCLPMAAELLAAHRATRPLPLPVLAAA